MCQIDRNSDFYYTTHKVLKRQGCVRAASANLFLSWSPIIKLHRNEEKMISSVFFLLAFLSCLTACLLLPKTKETVSLIRSSVVCYLIVLCIGALLAFPLHLLSVPINLISMGCVYLIISLLIFFYIFRKKRIQKYTLHFFDAATAILLLLFVCVVIWRVFSFHLDLNYYNSDPGVHFLEAMKIVRSGKLGSMYFAPLYNALFIELLEPFFSGIYAYKAFILAESLSNYMAGMMFYVLIASGCKSKKIQKLSPIITLMYFAGWPLYNYVLGGFVYWGIGVTLAALGIYLLRLYPDYKEYQKHMIALIVLLLYNIAMCYMLFIPYAAALFFLMFLYQSWDKIKKIDKRILIGITAGAVLFCVALFLFAFFTYFHGNIKRMLSALSRDGGIHLSFYRDFIFFVPFIFYIGGRIKKQKEPRFHFFALSCYFFMVLASLILCFSGIMSPYYYYKLYYMLWLLLWLVTVDAVGYILEETHAWFFGYLGMLAFMFVYTFTPVEDYIIRKGLMNYAYSEFPMYSANGSYVKSPVETRYTDDFWEVIIRLTDNGESAPLVGAPLEDIYLYWYEAITGYESAHVKTADLFREKFIDSAYQDDSVFAIMKSCEYYEEYKEELSSYPVFFENDFAIVFETGK